MSGIRGRGCRRALIVMALLLGVAAVAALLASSGQAFDFHDYLSTPHITEVPSTGPNGEPIALPGLVTELDTMTVAEGHLWIAEHMAGTTDYRIDEFNAETGDFMAQPVAATEDSRELRFGVAVAAGELYAGERKAVAVFTEAGALQEAWTSGCSGAFSKVKDVAVDNSASGDPAEGFVYVLDENVLDESTVDVFKPEAGGKGACVASLTVTGAEHIAVNQGDGDLAVSTRSEIKVYEPEEPSADTYAYHELGRITGPPPTSTFGCNLAGVAFDAVGAGEIYAAETTEECSTGTTGGGVDEFDTSGAYLGRTNGEQAPGNTLGSGGPNEGLAVDPADHELFVGVYHQSSQEGPDAVDTFGPDIVVPDVETTGASGEEPTADETIEATLTGAVNPLSEGKATCDFVWGASAEALEGSTPEHETPCEAGVPEGSSAEAVHAKVVLEPDVTYYVRLQAANKNGENTGEAWQDRAFTTEGPGLLAQSVSHVSAEAATLEATVDANGAPGTYYFEYGLTGKYGSDTAAVSIGSHKGDVNVSRYVPEPGAAKLNAGAEYHYRMVVESTLDVKGKTETLVYHHADQTFRTQLLGSPLQLLDGRQWELVSSGDTHGGKLLGLGGTLAQGIYEAAAGGDSMTYLSDGVTEGAAQGSAGYVQVLSERGSVGWRSEDIAAPHVESQEASGNTTRPEVRFFSPNLSIAVVEPVGPFAPLEVCSALTCEPESTPEATEQTVYVRHNAACVTEGRTCYEPLVTGAKGCEDVEAGTKFGGQVKFLAASPNGKHVVIEAPLSPGAAPSVVEWSVEEPCAKLSQPIGEVPGSGHAGGAPTNPRGAVSEDGSRVFWQQEASGYVDVTDLPMKETLQVGGGTAEYETASANGSMMFFTEPGKVYVCRIVEEGAKVGCQLTDLAPNAETVGNTVFASEDGSYVYFVASGVLTGDERSPGGEVALPGSQNLYVRHYDAASGQWEPPRLVAVLSARDAQNDFNGGSEVEKTPVRVSPNGRWIVFMSERSLTGYDNRDLNPEAHGAHDQEVFLYHAQSAGEGQGSLACVSCNPSGGRPTGQQTDYTQLVGNPLQNEEWFSGLVPRWNEVGTNGRAVRQPRYLSNGGRVFFDSTEALVPQDVNGSIDVYEYEPPSEPEIASTDTCTTDSSTYSARDDGCIDLISSGESSRESAFLDASEDGDDVFFLTTSKLLAADAGSSYAVYDAHACDAEAPCLPAEAATPLPCTTAEGCREAPPPQPSVFGLAASATFSGAGNASTTSPQPKPAVKLTRKRKLKLKQALKACRVEKKRKRRAACEKQTRRYYGSKAARKRARKADTRSRRGR